jgi:hypothetical protein
MLDKADGLWAVLSLSALADMRKLYIGSLYPGSLLTWMLDDDIDDSTQE